MARVLGFMLISVLVAQRPAQGQQDAGFAAAHAALQTAERDFVELQRKALEQEPAEAEECRVGRSSARSSQAEAEEAAKFDARKIFCEAIEGVSIGKVGFSFSLQAKREMDSAGSRVSEQAEQRNDGVVDSCGFNLPPINFNSVTVSNAIIRLPDGQEVPNQYKATVIGCLPRLAFRNAKFIRHVGKLRSMYQRAITAATWEELNMTTAELASTLDQLRAEFKEKGFQRALRGLDVNLLSPLARVAAGQPNISIAGPLMRIKLILPALEKKYPKREIEVIYSDKMSMDRIRAGIPLLKNTATQWVEDFKELKQATVTLCGLPHPDIVSISLSPLPPTFRERLRQVYAWFRGLVVTSPAPLVLPTAKLRIGRIRLRTAPSVQGPLLANFFSIGEDVVIDSTTQKVGWRYARLADGTWVWIAQENFVDAQILTVKKTTRLYAQPFHGDFIKIGRGTKLLILSERLAGYEVYYAYEGAGQTGWVRKTDVKAVT